MLYSCTDWQVSLLKSFDEAAASAEHLLPPLMRPVDAVLPSSSMGG